MNKNYVHTIHTNLIKINIYAKKVNEIGDLPHNNFMIQLDQNFSRKKNRTLNQAFNRCL